MKRYLFIPALAVLFVQGCNPNDQGSQTEEVEKVKEVGQLVSGALLQGLGGQLKAALQAGGPESAMQACQQVAALTTKAIGDNYDSVSSLRRTTLKPRNPGNAPDEIDRIVLGKLESMEELPSEHIEWSEETARYYKPLVIQEVCLKCHGEPAGFSPELQEKLVVLYPDDQATGYGLGELRGVIRVDVIRN